MQAFFISILFQVVQKLVGGQFFTLVQSLVQAAASTEYEDVPATETSPAISANEQRKLAVTRLLKSLRDDLGDKARELPGFLLSMVIDAAVGSLKGKGLL